MPKMFGMTSEQVKEFKEFDAKAGMEGPFNVIKRIVRFAASVAISRAKKAAEKAGKPFDEARAQAVADSFIDTVGEGTFWDWLKNGGFEMIVKMILEALALFI